MNFSNLSLNMASNEAAKAARVHMNKVQKA